MTTINRKVSGRELRRTLARTAPAAEIALQNEQVTRLRVEALEASMQSMATLVVGVQALTFLARLRWLFTGRA